MLEEAIGFGLGNLNESEPKMLVLKPCLCDIFNFSYAETKNTIITQKDTYVLETATAIEQTFKGISEGAIETPLQTRPESSNESTTGEYEGNVFYRNM